MFAPTLALIPISRLCEHQFYPKTLHHQRRGIPILHHLSVLDPVPSLPAEPVFDDRILHYDPANPMGSVIHPSTGTIVEILSISEDGLYMEVLVSPAE